MITTNPLSFDLFNEIVESKLSESTKHEIIEWLWAEKLLNDTQRRLALVRIKSLAEQEQPREKRQGGERRKTKDV